MGRTAFTLIELLVVIAVIAVLISLLAPSLAGARRAGENIRCIANLRQIALISQQYAHENDGFGPALGVPWGRKPFWALVVQHAVRSDATRAADLYAEQSVLVCPSANRRLEGSMTRTYATSVTGLAGAPGDRANFDDEPVHVRLWLVGLPSQTAWYLDSDAAPVVGAAPPPTRTISTIDFRSDEHIAQRIGRFHRAGSEDGFNVAAFDGSAGIRREVAEPWRRPLP